MGMILAIGLAAAILLALAIQLVWIAKAPRGWQDATTFRPGPEPYDGARDELTKANRKAP
jgi:hypothetical protein